MPAHLEGKVAIVTGAAGGIGSGIATTFAEQGARVVVTDNASDVEGRAAPDPTRVDSVVDRIRSAGGEAVGSVGDIADMDHAESVVRLALDTWGKLDIIACAHGILRERMVFNMVEEEWDEVVRVHLKGCFTITKFASIHWRQTRAGGRIIYVTSDAGVFGSAGQPNYSAAHAGKLGLMRSNARGLDRYGVTCNCIAPFASTRMTDRGRNVDPGAPPPSESAAGTSQDPKNIAPIAVWLASDEGGVATGHIFGATGHRISVYREPVQERVLFSDEPSLDVDSLFEAWDQYFGVDGFHPEPRWLGPGPSLPVTSPED